MPLIPYIPHSFAKGDRYRIPLAEPVCQAADMPPDEHVEFVIEGRLIDDPETATGKPEDGRGRLFRPQPINLVSDFGERTLGGLPGRFLVKQGFLGDGRWHRDGAQDGQGRGRVFVPWIWTGCLGPEGVDAGVDGPKEALVTDPLIGGVDETGRRVAHTAVAKAFLDGVAAQPRGRVFHHRAYGGCNNIEQASYDFDLGLKIFKYRQDGPYVVDVFGHRCVFCPTAFMTVEPPCLGCSFRPEHINPGPLVWQTPGDPCRNPHRERRNDWASGLSKVLAPDYETVESLPGKAHCIEFMHPGIFPPCPSGEYNPIRRAPCYDPDVHIQCDVDANGGVGEYHCERCVYERVLGRMASAIVGHHSVLNRIPLKPIYGPGYGCGKWGFQLHVGVDDDDDKEPGLLLDSNRILSDMPRNPDGDLEMWESPAGGMFIPGGPFSGLTVKSNGVIESGRGFCGAGLTCACNDQLDIFCTTTHAFRWRKNLPGLNGRKGNLITTAQFLVRDYEWCDPMLGPCKSNPIQEAVNYNQVPSKLMVWMTIEVRIQLEFDHWGPNPPGGNNTGCGCCLRINDDASSDLSDLITMHIVGRYEGPVPWGNLGGTVGYMAEGQRTPLTPGIYPQAPTSYPDAGECAGWFVHQGTYDDPLGLPTAIGQPGDPNYEPFKRCPSCLDAGKCRCLPNLTWMWSTVGGKKNNWSDLQVHTDPNQVSRGRTCIAAELLRNDANGCSQGTIVRDGAARGCYDPNCRRGCSMEETVNAQGIRLSPYGPQTPLATPGGCGQCSGLAPIYPPD